MATNVTRLQSRHPAADVLQVRLLGPVEVLADGAVHDVSGTRRRATLAALALQPGHTVSRDHLIEVVWMGDHPATAANTLQANISYLRALMRRREAILPRSPGYVLRMDGDVTDVQEAVRLIERAKSAPNDHTRERDLRAALSMWRGRPLVDVGDHQWFAHERERLERIKAGADKALIDVRLDSGQHFELIPELTQLARVNPFDEDVHAQLMIALYRSGRQVEALSTFQHVRWILADEVGIDPGQGLRELHSAILRQDPSLDLKPKSIELVDRAEFETPA